MHSIARAIPASAVTSPSNCSGQATTRPSFATGSPARPAAAGSLSHPNIVTIYDVGEHDGLPFIAMEYVRGETFADLVCLRPPLSVLRKVQLTEEVCAGLAHAHEAGIVHRDIKPANLIVGPEGTVKILDFGIAKLTATGITVAGAIMGTLNYMSPEQVKGTSVDAASGHLLGRCGVVRAALASTGVSRPGSGRGASPDPERRPERRSPSTAPRSTRVSWAWLTGRSRRIRIDGFRASRPFRKSWRASA